MGVADRHGSPLLGSPLFHHVRRPEQPSGPQTPNLASRERVSLYQGCSTVGCGSILALDDNLPVNEFDRQILGKNGDVDHAVVVGDCEAAILDAWWDFDNHHRVLA